MARRRKGARVLGPYTSKRRDGGCRYRIVVVTTDGARKALFADSAEEAEKLKRAAHLELGIADPDEMTMRKAVNAFIERKRRYKAWSRRTEERTGRDLWFFAAQGEFAPVACVNVLWMRRFLERMEEAGNSLAYQKTRWGAVVEFLRWCVKMGWLKTCPADGIDVYEKPWTGKRAKRKMGRGKPQLRNAREVQRYLEAANKLDRADFRVAVQLPLLVGLRSGEVRHLQVGDVDFLAKRLWIREVDAEDFDDDEGWDVKTASSRRSVELPELLVDDLVDLTGDRGPEEMLFASNRNPGKPWGRQWLNRHVHRVCELAGVRDVPAHGLRDTYSSFLKGVGKSAPEIGRWLGHADHGTTARQHYIGEPEHKPALQLQVIEGGRK